MSVAIELTQYITELGIAEFDDVFGNTMGGWIGVLVAWMWVKSHPGQGLEVDYGSRKVQ